MGGEALGAVKTGYPCVGEFEDREEEVGGWVEEHPHRSRGRGDRIGGFPGGKQGINQFNI